MTQNWSILVKFAKKNPAKSAVFYWLFLGEVSPRNFPWNQRIFLRICHWKSFEILPFSAKIPRNQPILPRICPWKSREILLFFLQNIRSPEEITKAWFGKSCFCWKIWFGEKNVTSKWKNNIERIRSLKGKKEVEETMLFKIK